jgi:hypothetical protein
VKINEILHDSETMWKLLTAILTFVALMMDLRAQSSDSARERLKASANAVRQQRSRAPYPFRDEKVFHVIGSGTIAGAGFLLQDGEKIYAVTAAHPFQEGKPTEFTDGEHEILLGSEILDTNDILSFTANVPAGSKLHLIARDGRIFCKGDAIAVICHDGVREGSLTARSLPIDGLLLPEQPVNDELQFTVPGTKSFDGNSGAPVILKETGEVIGVLTGAVNLSRETIVSFAPLSLDASATRSTPHLRSVFGLNPRGGVTDKVDYPDPLPPELFQILPGTPISDLLAVRPYLPDAPQAGLHGHQYVELLGKDFLFDEATFTTEKGKLNCLEFFGSSLHRNLRASRVEAMFDWFFKILGQPDEAFRFGQYRNKPGNDSVYCSWMNSRAEVRLGAYANSKGAIFFDLMTAGPGMVKLEKSWSDPLPVSIPSLQAQVRKLMRQAQLKDNVGMDTDALEKDSGKSP